MRLAVVGAGTGKVFAETAEPNVSVTFTPSKVRRLQFVPPVAKSEAPVKLC